MDTMIPPEKSVASVPVDCDTLRLAMERTGLEDPAQVVAFALRLLTQADPSAEIAQAARGSLPELHLDI